MPVIVPHRRLSPQALRGLIEEFVTRPGTDNGDTAASLEENVAAVIAQLEGGTVGIVYDEATATANIVPEEILAELRPNTGS